MARYRHSGTVSFFRLKEGEGVGGLVMGTSSSLSGGGKETVFDLSKSRSTAASTRLIIEASRAATRTLGLHPPLTSVPSPTVMPSSSKSRTGHIPDERAELLMGQWLTLAPRSLISWRSSGVR